MNDLDKKLKDFRVKMLPEYSMETLKVKVTVEWE